ncbi:FkbM family methyltransferase [Bosea sp. NPDC055353]
MKTEEVICRGIRFPYDSAILSTRVLDSLRAQRYEQKEAKQLASLIAQGERVLELGAGLGFMSTLAGLNPYTEQVLSFEADPRLVGYIQRVHTLNGVENAEIRNGVLTAEGAASTIPFFVRQNFWGSSLEEKSGDYVDKVMVPSISLTEAVMSFRPTMIVSDIEGAEVATFRDAALAGVKKIIVELHTNVVGREGVASLFYSMMSRGFVYDEYNSNGSVVTFIRDAKNYAKLETMA